MALKLIEMLFVYFVILSWCGPCRMLSPALEKATSDTQFSNGKEVDLITIDTDEESALAQKYKVRSTSLAIPNEPNS